MYIQVLKDIAHIGLGLAFANSNDIFTQLRERQKLVELNAFSLYAHDTVP
jgi:hypothetical protein